MTNKKETRKANPNPNRRRQTNRGDDMSLSRSNRSTPLHGSQTNARPVRNRPVRIPGSDYLQSVTVKSNPTDAPGRILATFPISPSGYKGTRLTQLSSNWERYRFKSLNVRYVSAVPATLACQLVLYIDTDPNDDPTVIADANALIRQAVAQAGSRQWNFHSGKTIPLVERADDQLYYTGVDRKNDRLSRQGTAYLIQVTNPISMNGTPVPNDLEAGSLFLDWDVEFSTAQLEPEASGEAPGGFTTVKNIPNNPGGLFAIVTNQDCEIVCTSVTGTGNYTVTFQVSGTTLATGGPTGFTSQLVPLAAGNYPMSSSNLTSGTLTFSHGPGFTVVVS